MAEKIIFETDWLASQPIFFNHSNLIVSHNINDVIDFNNLEFDPEGFNNYLDYGYAVFGQTPIKGVGFLQANQRLTLENKQIIIKELPDPAEDWYGKVTSPEDAINCVYQSVINWEKETEGHIILPISGGYDSRLLSYCIQDKSRIRAFTYGISTQQSVSFEVVYAQALSKILGLNWQQITLGNYHQYIDDWNSLFGVSTHAHGMYHIEFYKKLLLSLNFQDSLFLSGVVGDAWAGSITEKTIQSPQDLVKLGHSHGMHADSTYSHLSSHNDLQASYFEKNHQKIQDLYFQTIETVRLKMILLCYLIIVPSAAFSFNVWSPFLIPEVALSMLTITQSFRKNRRWQTMFFKEQGLDIENMGLRSTRSNRLNYKALHYFPLPPLDIKLLRELVEVDYLHWINQTISGTSVVSSIWRIPKVVSALRRLGVRDPKLRAYFAYLTLKPIELVLRKRNMTQISSSMF